jgi:hypothetical protein
LQYSSAIGSLLKWMIFVAVVGVLIAPADYVSTSVKLVTLICAVFLLVLWLGAAFARWIKSDSKAPAWDEIKSLPPVLPEPPFTGGGPIGRAFSDRFAKWTVGRIKKDDPAYLNAMGEMFDQGTRYTPKDPVEAMRWYRSAVSGDPEANGPHYSKLRIAEMYEDGEGVERDLDVAARIYKTIPHSPAAMLHSAIAHVEGRGVRQDYVEAYKLLLLADKFYSWHVPSPKQVAINIQSHRDNRRHIRTRESMEILRQRMSPEQLLKATESAREWWNAHR